jgi:menaquinone-dependent protoporphyrinogen IX oxidase
MKGAIFYSTKYGSTARYANWIAEATGLPVFNVKDTNADPTKYNFLILGAPIIYFKVQNHKWVKANLHILESIPIIFFTVSGAPAGSKLDGWIGKSLPKSFVEHMNHVALRGRQNPKELTFYDKIMLKIGAMMNPDPVASKQELSGFDFMDKSSIGSILKLVEQFRMNEVSA